jgi:2-polyprenyl-3-methyl-5-hydroxy-6-metoxy-1,4-benzoquinol methylase
MVTSFIYCKRRCISCKENKFIIFHRKKVVIELPDKKNQTFDQQLECCFKCGLVRQQDNISYSTKNIDSYYKDTYRTPLDLRSVKVSDKRRKNAEKRLRFISKLKHGGSLLEIGFGDGVFLEMASEKYRATGLDPSTAYNNNHAYLKGKGISVHLSSLKKFNSHFKYDIICSFLVLEHIKYPTQFLSHVLKYMKKNSLLVLEVPDIDCYAKFNSETLLTHEHVYHYNISTLSTLLSSIKLELVAFTNNRVSYGFSLIAAFKLGKKQIVVEGGHHTGFDSLSIFELFFKQRELYLNRMSKSISLLVNERRVFGKKIGVYGTGFLFGYSVERCNFNAQDADYLFEDTPEKIGTELDGKLIYSINKIAELEIDILIIFSEMFFDLMKGRAARFKAHKDLKFVNIHALASGRI